MELSTSARRVFSLFLVLHRHWFAIPYDQQPHRLVPKDTRIERAILPAKCTTCGTVHLLFDGNVGLTYSAPKEKRYSYTVECWNHCVPCNLDLQVTAELSVLGPEWTFSHCVFSHCEPVALPGIEDLIKNIPWPSIDWEDNPEEMVRIPKGLAVFVEGDDDKLVIEEFLRKQTPQYNALGVKIFTGARGGGREQIVESAKFVQDVTEHVGSDISFIIVLDGDSSDWAATVATRVSHHLFLLSKTEIESYLLDSDALARTLQVSESEIVNLLKTNKGNGKQALERILQKHGFRPTAQVKQMITRQMRTVPEDFVKLMNVISRELELEWDRIRSETLDAI